MKKVVLILLLLCSTAYAEPNLLATGYDYVLMNDGQKTELISTLYKILKVDKAPEDGVVALDGFYYIYSNEVKNKEASIKVVFDRPVMSILAELHTMEDPKSYDEAMLKKYELKLKR